MKKTFKYIAFGIALLASSFALNAQGTYHRDGGMATSKKVDGPEGGYYTITLESFATGETQVTEVAEPVDIVLVLDVSGSMNENITTYTYTARPSQGYSYNTLATTYYYLHTDGNYYPVQREREWEGLTRYRRLYFSVGTTRYYLSGTGITTTPPTNVSGIGADGTTIWTGVLYNRNANTQTRLAALKSAVRTFVNTVNYNATHNSDGTLRNPVIHNQISVVKYASNAYYGSEDSITPGNHRGANGNNNYNYTEVVVGFTDVSTNAGVRTVMGDDGTGVDDMQQGGATASDYGMKKAWYLLNQDDIKNRESNKVVVLFTDGSPTYQNSFDTNVAGYTIANAKDIKDDFNATVFTIGVFDDETDNIRNYMNWTSSNYPNATGWNAGGTGSDKGFYQNASNADLDEIFKNVAHASGASDRTAGASTQVRDVVSNSFIMPDVDDAQITIYTSRITENGEGWETPVAAAGVTYEIKTVTTTTGEEHQELVVTGFDYTLADTKDDDGFTTRANAGNWVGERYSDATTKFWAGKKLIISFRIKANDEATGGDGTATNHPDSGIYVQKFNDDGTPVIVDGQPVYERVNQYDVPHTPLPLLIKIMKNGLRKGESATFQIFRIRPAGWDDEGETLEEKMKNVEYNAIGKPKPGIHDFDSQDGKLDPNHPMDYLEGIGWDDWSKVILTNKTGDNDYVEKDLYGLDPGWVYMVVEDDWGWAYELTGTAKNQTTSEYELNPFTFHNTPRTVTDEGKPILKHAEAVTINHFDDKAGDGHYEEHYKSSKTNFKSK